MRTVITISLNGNAYQLDAAGYEALRAYLQIAEQRLAGNPDQPEILADLEQAIADKCGRYLGPYKNVVSSEEIAEVLHEMGPVDGGAEQSAAAGRADSLAAGANSLAARAGGPGAAGAGAVGAVRPGAGSFSAGTGVAQGTGADRRGEPLAAAGEVDFGASASGLAGGADGAADLHGSSGHANSTAPGGPRTADASTGRDGSSDWAGAVATGSEGGANGPTGAARSAASVSTTASSSAGTAGEGAGSSGSGWVADVDAGRGGGAGWGAAGASPSSAGSTSSGGSGWAGAGAGGGTGAAGSAGSGVGAATAGSSTGGTGSGSGARGCDAGTRSAGGVGGGAGTGSGIWGAADPGTSGPSSGSGGSGSAAGASGGAGVGGGWGAAASTGGVGSGSAAGAGGGAAVDGGWGAADASTGGLGTGSGGSGWAGASGGAGIGGNGATGGNTSGTNNPNSSGSSGAAGGTGEPPRRLYQIREGAMISGVCKGLAAYLNIDVSIIRLAFVLLVFLTGGVWILVYLAMMFVIPYAQTSEQHAAAHGWPFNAEELVARAKAHYAEFRNSGKWHRQQWKEQRRMWKFQHKQWKEQQRAWKRWGSAQGVPPPPPPAWGPSQPPPNASYSAQLLHGVLSPVTELVGALLFIAFLIMLVSLITHHRIFGWWLPHDIPLWLGIVILVVLYRAIAAPLQQARYAAYYGTPFSHGWLALWGALVWLGLVIFLSWLAWQHWAEVQAFIQDLVNGLRKMIEQPPDSVPTRAEHTALALAPWCFIHGRSEVDSHGEIDGANGLREAPVAPAGSDSGASYGAVVPVEKSSRMERSTARTCFVRLPTEM
jgi:phage shock protein PspC (stress-responsive transcriptional regulator)